MDPLFGHEQASTLGAFVLALQAGCACVCCGAPLRAQVINGAGRSQGARATTASRRQTVMTCPDCGCEVAEVAADEAAVSADRVLNPAA
jgi:hypothetical protein